MTDQKLTPQQFEAARREIIRKYCRMTKPGPEGKPKFCNAGRDELRKRGRLRSGQENLPGGRALQTKVIFDSVEAAQACEQELYALHGVHQRAYPCPRSRHGHAHLSSRLDPMH